MEKKIDFRRKYILMVDVETIGTGSRALVYDLGFAVVDKKGNIYEEFSFVIEEIFDDKYLMEQAYYYNKYSNYILGLKLGTFTKVPFATAREKFHEMLLKYKIDTISAYNLAFDRGALQTTIQFLKQGEKFLTHEFGRLQKINELCIWSLACEVLYSRPTYIKFVVDNEFLTPAHNPKTSAEIGYRYLTKNLHFEEAHTGLEDVRIETQIMAYCFRQRQKHQSGVIPNPWRIVSRFKQHDDRMKSDADYKASFKSENKNRKWRG